MNIPVYFMGGQYNHLIVRALREIGVSSRIVMPNTKLGTLKDVDGLVLGGGPYSVYDGIERLGGAPDIVMEAPFPLLGICLSHQLIGTLFGGKVAKGKSPEYGKTIVRVIDPDDILKGVGSEFVAWASHNDEVRVMEGAKFMVLADSEFCKVEALKVEDRPIYGVQFHIEVADTPRGKQILRNFADICRK